MRAIEIEYKDQTPKELELYFKGTPSTIVVALSNQGARMLRKQLSNYLRYLKEQEAK